MKTRRSCWDAASIRVTLTTITSMIAQVCWNWNARMISHSTWPMPPALTSRILQHQPGDIPQQRALARAGCADQRDHLAGPDQQPVDLQRTPAAERLAQLGDLDGGMRQA